MTDLLTIDPTLLSAVTGGAFVLQPGATLGTQHPIVSSRPQIGLQPGATLDTARPVIRIQPTTFGLHPGSTI
jgi:hypothetical protein